MKGADLSHWNTVTDWNAIKKAGYQFCFIKCSQGTSFLDPTYKDRKSKIRGAGMLLGAYHFANLNDPKEEADWFLKNVGDLQPGEIVILDYETYQNTDPASWCLTWLQRVEEKLGWKPLLYTYHGLLTKYNWKKVSDSNYGLWAARYGLQEQEPNENYAPATGSWEFYAIWQYTSRGSVPGVVGYTDLNTTKMSLATLKKYGAPESVVVPPAPRTVVLPIDKIYITQEFSLNPQVYGQFGLKGHNGIDFRTKFWDSPLGRREIFATMDGKVVEVANQGAAGYGRYVRIRHNGNEETIYGHLYNQKVLVNQEVKAGHIIGISDNTGFSSGSHLHFGWRPENWNPNNGFAGYANPRNLFGKLLS
jgi:GH25 family lysozyme M1 (1,4-beta-N-acetylmuramidase)